jgi:hypothetical protein
MLKMLILSIQINTNNFAIVVHVYGWNWNFKDKNISTRNYSSHRILIDGLLCDETSWGVGGELN